MLSVKQEVSFTDNLEFFARQVVEGFLTGLHKSPYHGFSVEFAEHRLYNPGDEIKLEKEIIHLIAENKKSLDLKELKIESKVQSKVKLQTK